MRAYVTLRLPDGDQRELGHGDFIGRLPSAALHIDDERISEAHALVSLRGQQLKLLSLRGRFAVEQRPVSELTLRPGLSILLAQGLPLYVEEVVLPESVLAIEGEGLPRQPLAGVSSLRASPRPALVPRYAGDADAWIWSSGERWKIRLTGEPPRVLASGDSFVIHGRRFDILSISLESAGQVRTRALGRVGAPLRLVSYYDTAHLHRQGEPVFALRGISARIIGELVACGAPVSWAAIAQELWPDLEDPHLLRRRWDINLARLRKKLKEAGIRPDLVRSDHGGNVELCLATEDELVDHT